MQLSEIKTMMAQTEMPSTYYQWPEREAPALPYTVWYIQGSANLDADNRVYQPIGELNIELYTSQKDFSAEDKVEAVLDSWEIPWEKTETYIKSERMYQVLYQAQIVITPEAPEEPSES